MPGCTEIDREAPRVVPLAVEIDAGNSDTVWAELSAACLPGVGSVIADMSRTTFCDSSGVRALLQAHNLAAARGIELKFVVSTEAVLRVLELLGLHSTLRVYATVEKAVQS